MSDDSVMYDLPTEFLHEAANNGECVAQSVIPGEDGTYRVACCCEQWETTAETQAAGLNLARQHTGHAPVPL